MYQNSLLPPMFYHHDSGVPDATMDLYAQQQEQYQQAQLYIQQVSKITSW